ncbi:hypothetical protein ACFE04_030619 [Oxalis oulophora]
MGKLNLSVLLIASSLLVLVLASLTIFTEVRVHQFSAIQASLSKGLRSLREIGSTGTPSPVGASSSFLKPVYEKSCSISSMRTYDLHEEIDDDNQTNKTQVATLICDSKQFKKLSGISSSLTTIKNVIYFEDEGIEIDPTLSESLSLLNVSSISEIEKLGKTSPVDPNLPSKNSIAVIMYTSGSTGLPKGVMMTHGNIVATIAGVKAVVPNLDTKDVYLAYLPLAHVFELAAETLMMASGCSIGYGSALTFTDSSAVPAILDRVREGVSKKIEEKGGLAKKLFNIGYKRRLAAIEGSWLGAWGLEKMLWDIIVFTKVQALLGGRLRLMLCGGAPLSGDSQRFINICMGAPVGQGYGLTETCVGGTFSEADDLTVGRVGPPLPCGYIKKWCLTSMVWYYSLFHGKKGGYRISDKPMPRGEIVIGGNSVTAGYYNNPEKTNEVYKVDEKGIRWFYTGDVGRFHPDGCLEIIDRKKDIVKLQHGEYVSLGKVEAALVTSSYVDNIMVYADPLHNFCIALIVPSRQALEKWAQDAGIQYTEFSELLDKPEAIKEVQQSLSKVARAAKLEKFEIPGKIKLLADPWTPESGMVSASTLSAKKKLYGGSKKKLYGGREQEEEEEEGVIQPRGLANIHGICFANAAIQALAACTPLVKDLDRHSCPIIVKDGCPACTFKTLARKLYKSKNSLCPQYKFLHQRVHQLEPEVRREYGVGSGSCNDFIESLLKDIHEYENTIEGQKCECVFHSQMKGTFRTTYRCVQCNVPIFYKTTKSFLLLLHMDNPGKHDLEGLLNFQQPDDDYRCSFCNTKLVGKATIIGKPPTGTRLLQLLDMNGDPNPLRAGCKPLKPVSRHWRNICKNDERIHEGGHSSGGQGGPSSGDQGGGSCEQFGGFDRLIDDRYVGEGKPSHVSKDKSKARPFALEETSPGKRRVWRGPEENGKVFNGDEDKTLMDTESAEKELEVNSTAEALKIQNTDNVVLHSGQVQNGDGGSNGNGTLTTFASTKTRIGVRNSRCFSIREYFCGVRPARVIVEDSSTASLLVLLSDPITFTEARVPKFSAIQKSLRRPELRPIPKNEPPPPKPNPVHSHATPSSGVDPCCHSSPPGKR